MNQPEIVLRIPGRQEYLLIARTMLGGVAVQGELSVDEMDDLRMAADEACDFLLHQGCPCETLTLSVSQTKAGMTLAIQAALLGEESQLTEESVQLSQAVLETLIPCVRFVREALGRVVCIELTLPARTL